MKVWLFSHFFITARSIFNRRGLILGGRVRFQKFKIVENPFSNKKNYIESNIPELQAVMLQLNSSITCLFKRNISESESYIQM